MTDTDPKAGADVSRRALLGAVTTGVVGLAGCTGTDCDVGIEKTTQGTFQYGNQGTYEITIFNDNVLYDPCSGEIVVEDTLPPGITFVSVSGNWTGNVTNGVLTATNDNYTLGTQGSVTLEVTVDIAPAGAFPVSPPVENCATGTLGGETIHPVNNCVTHDFGGQTPVTETATPTATDSRTPTESPTRTPSDTATPRPTPTDTETATATASPTETATGRPTANSTATTTAVPTQTATESPGEPTPTEPETRQRR